MAVSTSLIHSYQFLPRNAIHSADYAVARCMSVRLSHAGIVYCVKTAKRILELFYRRVASSHTILVFIARQHTDARY